MLRVGCPEGLAARLYVDHLGDRVPPHTIIHQSPRALGEALASGELDVALVPTPCYYEREDYLLVPDASVSCQGESATAFLCLRKPLKECGRVGLDADYPSESTLVRVLLRERDRVAPEFVELPHGEGAADGSLDAWIACGELGAADGCGAPERIDLGEAWWRFARLPFVFAVWAVRKGADLKGFEKGLLMAKREGLRRAREMAQQSAADLGIHPKRIYEYLTRVLSCALSTVELGGMETFHRYAVKCGLAEELGGIEFYR